MSLCSLVLSVRGWVCVHLGSLSEDEFVFTRVLCQRMSLCSLGFSIRGGGCVHKGSLSEEEFVFTRVLYQRRGLCSLGFSIRGGGCVHKGHMLKYRMQTIWVLWTNQEIRFGWFSSNPLKVWLVSVGLCAPGSWGWWMPKLRAILSSSLPIIDKLNGVQIEYDMDVKTQAMIGEYSLKRFGL